MNNKSQSLMPFMDILTSLVGIIILLTIILALSVVDSDTVEVRLHHRSDAMGKSPVAELSRDMKIEVELRPLYVVCSGDGIQIGENRYPLPETAAQKHELRDILDAEVELMGQGAYLFALFKPDGYAAFQQLSDIVDELGIRFGYEPINSSWRLVK